MPGLRETLFSIWFSLLTASPQKHNANSLLFIMVLAISWISIFSFNYSFFCRLIGVKNFWWMPYSSQREEKLIFSNSLLWLLWILEIASSFLFCNLLKSFLASSKILYFYLRRIIQVILENPQLQKYISFLP